MPNSIYACVSGSWMERVVLDHLVELFLIHPVVMHRMLERITAEITGSCRNLRKLALSSSIEFLIFPAHTRQHLTRKSSAAPREGAGGYLWKHFSHVKGRKQAG